MVFMLQTLHHQGSVTGRRGQGRSRGLIKYAFLFVEVKGTHPELQKQLDDIQSVHDAKLSVARDRHQMTNIALEKEFNFVLESSNQQFYVLLSDEFMLLIRLIVERTCECEVYYADGGSY